MLTMWIILMMRRNTFTKQTIFNLINNHPQQTGFIKSNNPHITEQLKQKPGHLIINHLNISKDTSGSCWNNVLWLQLPFFSWCDSEFNCLYKPFQGEVLISHHIIFYSKVSPNRPTDVLQCKEIFNWSILWWLWLGR